jgi:hypothetical protein
MRLKLPVMLLALAVVALGYPSSSTAAPTVTLEPNCSQYPPFHGVDVSLSGFPPNTMFRGTLSLPSGTTYRDAGPFSTDANGNFFLGPFGTTVPGTFTVTINWAGASVTDSVDVNCALPTSKDQCKNGGWRTFPGFENQGDCVSFVSRHSP